MSAFLEATYEVPDAPADQKEWKADYHQCDLYGAQNKVVEKKADQRDKRNDGQPEADC